MSPISATNPTAVSVLDAAQAAQAGDGRGPRSLGGLLGDQPLQAASTRQQHLVMGQVLAEDQLDQLVVKAQLAEPVQVTLRPGLAEPGPDQLRRSSSLEIR